MDFERDDAKLRIVSFFFKFFEIFLYFSCYF